MDSVAPLSTKQSQTEPSFDQVGQPTAAVAAERPSEPVTERQPEQSADGEAVRLVVWDLDETFWKGTLTEGGIAFLPQNKAIVIELARRGIMSAICSKNELHDVENVLRTNDVWDYFVFPSVNWDPKGPRVKKLIDDVQLRPETVLFIDDNVSNLHEVRAFVPTIQVASDQVIPALLADRRFKGKDDSGLTRLAQYKLLEKRKRDEAATSGDNRAFLRSSNIRVLLELDIAGNVGRAVELINRTNQLNFTKVRVPEDLEEAKAAVLRQTSSYAVNAALVRVIDNYGDHGYCGLYIYRNSDHRLLHYCFSCRILGMEVERWLYQRLGSPAIDVKGEVLTDLFAGDAIDWVREITSLAEQGETSPGSEAIAQLDVVVRGDCSLQAIGHYLKNECKELVDEMLAIRNGIYYKRQHSAFLRQIHDGMSPEAVRAGESIGFLKEDFETAIFGRGAVQKIALLSFTDDGYERLYRHKETGLLVCIHAPPASGRNTYDLTKATIDDVHEHLRTPAVANILDVMRRDFELVGTLSGEDVASNAKAILDAIDPATKVFITVTSEATTLFGETLPPPPRYFSQIVSMLEVVAKGRPNVRLISPDPHILSRDDFGLGDRAHYSRMVYYRMYTEIAHAIVNDAAPMPNHADAAQAAMA